MRLLKMLDRLNDEREEVEGLKYHVEYFKKECQRFEQKMMTYRDKHFSSEARVKDLLTKIAHLEAELNDARNQESRRNWSELCIP